MFGVRCFSFGVWLVAFGVAAFVVSFVFVVLLGGVSWFVFVVCCVLFVVRCVLFVVCCLLCVVCCVLCVAFVC